MQSTSYLSVSDPLKEDIQTLLEKSGIIQERH